MLKEHLPTSVEDLANPARLAMVAVSKSRYARPTSYIDLGTNKPHIYDLDAALVDAMLESSLSPLHSLKIKPQLLDEARSLFPNEAEVMKRRQLKIDRQV
jgi:hypothetical protein